MTCFKRALHKKCINFPFEQAVTNKYVIVQFHKRNNAQGAQLSAQTELFYRIISYYLIQLNLQQINTEIVFHSIDKLLILTCHRWIGANVYMLTFKEMKLLLHINLTMSKVRKPYVQTV